MEREVVSHCHLRGKPLKIIELFSGIGGVSYAIRSLNLPVEPVITAFDINHVANDVHAFNFPDKKIFARNLTGVTAAELDCYGADVWTMSPPCQPFTRLGLQKDVDDNRADCFLHLMQSVFPALQQKPHFMLIENVKGFECSRARKIAIHVLQQASYHIRELLLSPAHTGIPNSRLRYYLIARRSPRFTFGSDDAVIQKVPVLNITASCPTCVHLLFPESGLPEGKESFEPAFPERVLQSFLSNETDTFFLSEKQLKYTQVLDIVKNTSEITCCFTRGYGHLLQGSGSVLQSNVSIDPSELMSQIKECSAAEQSARLRELGLRFFTPKEIANLMFFPEDFKFPQHVTDRQKYRLLGNSVNVQVVGLVLRLLLL